MKLYIVTADKFYIPSAKKFVDPLSMMPVGSMKENVSLFYSSRKAQDYADMLNIMEAVRGLGFEYWIRFNQAMASGMRACTRMDCHDWLHWRYCRQSIKAPEDYCEHCDEYLKTPQEQKAYEGPKLNYTQAEHVLEYFDYRRFRVSSVECVDQPLKLDDELINKYEFIGAYDDPR